MLPNRPSHSEECVALARRYPFMTLSRQIPHEPSRRVWNTLTTNLLSYDNSDVWMMEGSASITHAARASQHDAVDTNIYQLPL